MPYHKYLITFNLRSTISALLTILNKNSKVSKVFEFLIYLKLTT